MEGAFLTIIKGLKRKYPNERGKYFGALVALYNLCFEEPFAFDGGARSGNFNHAGRPGQVGGSAKTEQGGIKQKQMEYINEIIKKIDFTKDNILPGISKEEAEMLGVKERPYLLKKSIGERNKRRHPDIDDNKAKEILVKALYQRDKILQGVHEDKPDYYHFAAFVDGYNYLALVDFTPTKEYNEIVHYHIMRQKEFMRLVRHTVEKGKNIYE